MKRGGWAAWIGALLVALPSGWSEPPPESDHRVPPSAAAAPRASAAESFGVNYNSGAVHSVVQISFGPAVSKSKRLKVKLKAAYLTAVDRLRRGSDCRALFAPFEADGVDMLTRSVYARANAGMEATWCRQAVAGTSVGKKMVFLCRRFASLPVEEAATILIHEAMHRAGMSESQLDRGLMTGDEISSMVRRACLLFDDANDIRVASVERDRVENSVPTDPVGTALSAVQVARAGSVSIPRMTSRFMGVVDMRSSLLY
jgi:hypothetical protein